MTIMFRSLTISGCMEGACVFHVVILRAKAILQKWTIKVNQLNKYITKLSEGNKQKKKKEETWKTGQGKRMIMREKKETKQEKDLTQKDPCAHEANRKKEDK